jgi:hypothetical protein
MSCLHGTNKNFKFQPAGTSYFFLTKVVSFKVFQHFKIYQRTKFHGFTLTGPIFTSTSEVLTSTILECLKLTFVFISREIERTEH